MKVQGIVEAGTRQIVVSELDSDLHAAITSVGFIRRSDTFWFAVRPDANHFDQVVANWRRDGEAFLGCIAQRLPSDWRAGLRAFLGRACRADAGWFLLGSTALAVRGVDVVPGDIDVSTSEEGAWEFDDLFADHLIYPTSELPGFVAKLFGRIYWHIAIEWAGGISPWVEDRGPRPWGFEGKARLEVVEWEGYQLSVTPLDLQLRDEQLRGRQDHVHEIERFIADRR